MFFDRAYSDFLPRDASNDHGCAAVSSLRDCNGCYIFSPLRFSYEALGPRGNEQVPKGRHNPTEAVPFQVLTQALSPLPILPGPKFFRSLF